MLRWIKNAHKLLQELLDDFNPLVSEKADIIELNIYLCKKRKTEQSYGLLILGDKSALLRIQSEKE